MIINKLALPRRTFLQGLGAGIALPMLDAMAPALSAAPAAIPRVGFFYVPNGMYLPNFHPKGNGGTSFEYTPILKPLEPLRSQVVVVSGLANLGVISPNEGGGVHTRAHGGWLSGVLPKRTEGSDLTAGKTIDQYAADVLGKDTSLRSLELTTEATFTVGNCENGYSCAYLNSTSWRTPNTPLPHERDPRVVFERLFGDGGSVSARLAAMRTDRSILDSVSASLSRLERRRTLQIEQQHLGETARRRSRQFNHANEAIAGPQPDRDGLAAATRDAPQVTDHLPQGTWWDVERGPLPAEQAGRPVAIQRNGGLTVCGARTASQGWKQAQQFAGPPPKETSHGIHTTTRDTLNFRCISVTESQSAGIHTATEIPGCTIADDA